MSEDSNKKRRNWAVLAVLLLFVAVVYGVTIVKMVPGS
jgi:hypothetical protein